MSPKNSNLDLDRTEPDEPDVFELKRLSMPAVSRGPMQRSKRIRTLRRGNSSIGMERRRNKRINW